MKNSIYLIALGLLTLASCSKDNSFEQTDEQSIDSMYVLKQLGATTSWNLAPIGELPSSTDFIFTSGSEDLFGETNGAFISSTRDPNTITWNGIEDETGAYGDAEVLLSRPSYTLRLQIATECVQVDGSQAVYGGVVTQVLESSGNPPPFTVNWRFYFKAMDSNRSGAPGYDQISVTRIFASPRSQSLCNIYLPDHRIWSSQGYETVGESGYIDVLDLP